MNAIRNLTFVFLLFIMAHHALGQYNLESRLTGNPGFQYHPSPADWRDVNMYQLFTDRFFDGNTNNNFARQSTASVPWYNYSGSNAETNRHFFQGGDWAGVKQKLDYLQGMGVNCIWISGVQINEQGIDKRFTPYHAYHPSDFYKVEPMFGTFAELKDLIDTAHNKGIYVVLDVVVNHMADLLKYTDCNCNYDGYCENNCAGLAWWNNSIQFGPPFNNPALFHNNGTIGDNDWDTYPKYVKGAFLGTEDLKTEDPFVQNELRWAFKNLIDAADCDGFRVDAIKHMEYDFIKQWADDMRKHAASRGKNNFILFGEYFSYDDNTQAAYCKDVGYSFNSTLWFPMQLTLKNVFAYEQGTVQLANRMGAMNLYGEAKDRLVAFLDNHDVDRIALECGSQWEAKLRPALTFLYTAMPVPCLFYGTEHGFNQGERRNGSPKLGLADFQRECMMNFGFQWGNAFGDKFVQSPLYNHIKKLNELRAQYSSLRRGAITQRWSEGGKGLFAISRVDGNEESLIAINTDWGSKSLNPQVSKPNGTVFKNVLNPAETVTVANGQLSFSVDGKGSKIFVAGLGNSVVATSCNATNITITYKPNGGPLANPVGNIRMGIGRDGNQNITNVTMSPVGNDWTYVYPLAGITNDVTFWFYDESAGPTYDNNNGQNWTVITRYCGAPALDLQWIGNEYHWPPSGEWDPGEALWVNVESWPQNAVMSGEVVYSPDGGATWTSKLLTINGQIGNNDAWHANLGAYPGGTLVKYAIRLSGRNGDFWLNNGGADYSNRVNTGASAVQWIGNVYHWPENGSIESGDDLWVNIESWPIGAGATGEVVYSSDGGATWQAAGLSRNGTVANNDWWNKNLGAFPPNTTIRYALKIRDGNGIDHWANNGGTNYIAVINPASSSLKWFGNTKNGSAPSPHLGIRQGAGKPILELEALKSNGVYAIFRSTDLKTWALVVNYETAASEVDMLLSDAGESNALAFYRVEPQWVPGAQVFEDEELIISIETWPIGGAKSANIVYSENGGATWKTKAMRHGGTRGNNDVWSVALGKYPIGATIKYAIEIIDGFDASHWANNGGLDYTATVFDPNVTDFDPPATSYSPPVTTTSNATLNVTLMATDDIDPSPVIYYTTNGATPTAASAVYGSPIHVTDKGPGVDMVIKFFARDASGNTSGVTTIEVKVNETFSFGGSMPYSLNPTLGKAVPNGSIAINGNPSGWTSDMLIALDLANDDPRSLGSNWTMHEAPADLTHLWAAWDDNNLYLAWQFVDVTDVLDPSNAGSALAGRVSNSQGILQFISFDTVNGQGAVSNMWSKNDKMTGADKPDYQIGLRSDLFSSYISKAVNGVFPVDDGGINYFTTSQKGITIGKGEALNASQLHGVTDIDHYLSNTNTALVNFLSSGHNGARDSFYEMSIPFAALGITRAQLEAQGIGVFINVGSTSSMDTIPHDPATLNTPGTTGSNSSFEWEDTDLFTAPYARIGAGK